ncbi:MAG: hypothetical protein J7J51_03100 [Candidatus Omnitrophica bacterium]|nr:hypothetical protein [Candidatus Omnitrophota bacterium]
MFFPQKMHMVRMFALKDSLDKLSQVLYDFGFIEVERADNFIPRESGLSLLDNSGFIEKSRELKESIKETLSLLNIKQNKKDIFPPKISTAVIDEIQRDYGPIISDVQRLSTKIEENQKKIDELNVYSTILELIREKGLELRHFKGSENISVKVGIAPEESAKNLESYNSDSIFIEVEKRYLGNVFIFSLSLKDSETRLLSILKSVKFKEVFLDFESSSIKESIENVELNIWQLREESVECRQRLRDIRKQYQVKLTYALLLLEENERIYQAMNCFFSSRAGYIVTGWVPQNKIKALEAKLKEFDGLVHMEKESAESLIKKGFDFRSVPSYLGHRLFKPFEQILKFYGLPAYRNFDPTIFMALSFIVMFGMMFADLGHGLSLAVMGLCLGFLKRLKDAARVLISCGISGALFGIVFGSCFGREDVFKPLWFSPKANPQRFLLIGICFGIMMITLGIVMNIFQNLKNKKIREALFSQWGMLSVIFYWLALYLIVASLRYNALKISLGWVFVILLIPLIAIILGGIWGRRNDSDMVEVIFSPVEIVLGLVTNTISFVRVAAFGLAHAALGGCVYLVAYNLGSLPGFKESVVIEGNIGVILFEGLIVFIQALRLEFYEFFSKFFSSQGREFKPLRERN